jgi:hypothetical protein
MVGDGEQAGARVGFDGQPGFFGGQHWFFHG